MEGTLAESTYSDRATARQLSDKYFGEMMTFNTHKTFAAHDASDVRCLLLIVLTT